MNAPRPVRAWLHRRGWIASPSLAFQGVPFGPQKRDLAGQVVADIWRGHNPKTCTVCNTPDEEWP